MSGSTIKKRRDRAEKGSVWRWVLIVFTYLCFVAELAFIIGGEVDYGIIFAGLCFCLVIVFFVLWREEQTHRLLTLQSSLDDALHRERMGNTKAEHEQMKRLRREKEELACEREEAKRQLETLAQEKEALAQQLEAAWSREKSASLHGAAESILPSDENPQDLDLVTVAVRVAAKMEDACTKAGIRLKLSCPNEALFCRADERYIQLMIKNIIDNSIKYMRRRGSLIITLSGLGNDVFLAFKDDGMGLAQKEMEHIFELNYQGSNRVGGNGLGLAQVKAAVCRLGGSVYARSVDGMGIYIRFPVSGKSEAGGQGREEGKAEETVCEWDKVNQDTAGGE